jgi:adenylate kinase
MFDRARMATESQASQLSGMFPEFLAENKIYEAERKEANRLAHRRQDLEAAITNLQLGSFAPRVHAIIDRHLAALPPKSEQDKSDLKWRLALHRMDFRQYTISDKSGEESFDAEANADEPPKRYVRLEPKDPDADVQAMVDEHNLQYIAMTARLDILMWGIKVFQRENGKFDPSQWGQKLAEARTMDREAEQDDGSRNAPGFVAAVCVRDHWEEMSVDEREWCVEVVCSEVLRQADQWGHVERMQRHSMAADRPSALVVSMLLSKALPEPQMDRVRRAFMTALTHPIEEVRWYATWGINGRFWAADPVVALRCVNAIATEAALIDQKWEAEKRRPYQQRRSMDEIGAEAATAIHQRFWQEGAIAEDAHSKVDISKGFVAEANARMLAILRQVPNSPTAVAAFARTSRTLVGWWDADDRRARNYENEAEISKHLQHFVMRTTSESALEVLRPVLDAIDRHPREIHQIVEGLTAIEDSWPNTPQYWFLWGVFADVVKSAKWVSRLNDKFSSGSEMLSAIFLTSCWKDNVRHWKRLEGYAHHVHALFEALLPSSIVLDAYVRFLFHIGEQSLPEAFVRIANSLKRGDAQAMLRKTNTVFLLEVLLQRHVYGRPLELKSDPNFREAILFLLDILVESGSSAAFRMRDDFVTPGPS